MKDFTHLFSFVVARNMIEAGTLSSLSDDELVASFRFLRDRMNKYRETIEHYEKELQGRRIIVESDD